MYMYNTPSSSVPPLHIPDRRRAQQSPSLLIAFYDLSAGLWRISRRGLGRCLGMPGMLADLGWHTYLMPEGGRGEVAQQATWAHDRYYSSVSNSQPIFTLAAVKLRW